MYPAGNNNKDESNSPKTLNGKIEIIMKKKGVGLIKIKFLEMFVDCWEFQMCTKKWLEHFKWLYKLLEWFKLNLSWIQQDIFIQILIVNCVLKKWLVYL